MYFSFNIVRINLITLFFFGIGYFCNLQAQNNFAVNTATYLATDEEDEINGVDVAPDGSIVIAGKLPSYSAQGKSPINLLGGGDAKVVRLNSSGTQILSITSIAGNTINDIQVCLDGTIAITGSFGVGVLNAQASSFLWLDQNIQKGTVEAHTNSFYQWFDRAENKKRYKRTMSRVAIGDDGLVATIQQVINYGPSYLYVYDKAGTLVYDSVFPATQEKIFPDRTFTAYNINVYPNDICVDSKNKSILIGGWNPRFDDQPGYANHPIHMPYIKCFSYSGELKWLTYDWRAREAYNKVMFADSRFNDLVMGRDGYLYTTGYIHGGDHMFLFDPKDINKRTYAHVGYDSYSNAATMGAGIDHAYICKYDPATGDILKSQAVIVRKKADGTDKPNQSQVKGIMADEKGRVYMAGYCQPYIKNRALQTINNIPVGARDTCESFILVIDSTWLKREIWTVTTKNKLEGTFWGLSYRNGVITAAGEVFGGEAITTPNALQSSRRNGYDGYLVCWGKFENTTANLKTPFKFQLLYRSNNNQYEFQGEFLTSVRIFDTSGKIIHSTKCLPASVITIPHLITDSPYMIAEVKNQYNEVITLKIAQKN
jgi:hypothetical protein